jgi:hypothetical protein
MSKTVKSIAIMSALSLAPTLAGLHVAELELRETVFSIMDIQDGANWGLDRVDGALDGKYTYPGNGGSDVDVYVVDTGVDAGHPEFEGRVRDGFDSFGENLDQKDCQGHGTHVAGVVAGRTYGVAKKATIIPVRVLNCSGQGNTSTLTAGIDWILSNHKSASPAIVNMSLGGAKDLAVNYAVSKLISAGFIVTAAAGNFSSDACNYSPASADGVIAVGSIDQSNNRSSFSNWGACVDIFAPGSKIISASPFNYSSYASKSGTSQASPFVAGAIATYLSSGVANSKSSAEGILYSYAQVGAVLDSKYQTSRIVSVTKPSGYVAPPSDVVAAPNPEPTPVATTPVEAAPIVIPIKDYSPVGLSISKTDAKSISLAWNSVVRANKYVVRVGKSGALGASYISTTDKTQIKISGLSSNTSYWVTVLAYNGKSSVAISSQIEAYTSAGTPSAPTGLTLKLDKLFWSAPLYDGGHKLITYKVQRLSAGSWITVTTSTTLGVTLPKNIGEQSVEYRVIASTAAGDSQPSNVAVYVDTGAPQRTIPVPNVDPGLSNSVSVTQMGAGSGFVKVSWDFVVGSIGYKIQKTGHGVEDWADVASTSKNSRIITIQPGTIVVLRVLSNTGQVLGVVQYEGLVSR